MCKILPLAVQTPQGFPNIVGPNPGLEPPAPSAEAASLAPDTTGLPRLPGTTMRTAGGAGVGGSGIGGGGGVGVGVGGGVLQGPQLAAASGNTALLLP